jgi:hypothetical protein
VSHEEVLEYLVELEEEYQEAEVAYQNCKMGKSKLNLIYSELVLDKLENF